MAFGRIAGPSADGEFIRIDRRRGPRSPRATACRSSTPSFAQRLDPGPRGWSARCSRCAALDAGLHLHRWRAGRAISGRTGSSDRSRVRRTCCRRSTSPNSPERIHVRHAGEVVLRELREVEHGDLAILLLHLRARQARVRVGCCPPASARARLSAAAAPGATAGAPPAPAALGGASPRPAPRPAPAPRAPPAPN